MLKRIAAASTAALALALGGTGAALASNGADDPPGHHQEHGQGNGHKGKHHHHGRHHHHGKGDDHGGKGKEPGDDNGGKSESAPEEAAPPMSEYGY